MNVSTSTLLDALRAIAGNHARPATAGDAVADVQPQVVVEPADEREVAAVLAYANERGLAVLPRGGGTQSGMGAPPSRGDILLSLRRLNQIVEHVPHDLTVSVLAGTPLTTLQATLAGAGQWLALDPALAPGATVGGLLSTNVSGPRRLRYGGARDQLIGLRVALADGTLAKGGGKVVKNVAGYDLPKLFTGALGTLGVIVSATFRVYPMLPFSRTVRVEAASAEPLCHLALSMLGTTLTPTAIDIAGTCPGEGAVLAARFESRVAAAVEEQSARVAEMASGIGTVAALTDQAEQSFWIAADQDVSEQASVAAITTKTSVLPAQVVGWLSALRAATDDAGITATFRAHAGHGLIETRLTGDHGALARAVETLRTVAGQHGGSLVVTDAPPAFAATVDVWGPVQAIGVMRRLKERFDPAGTLNPGRFVGGI